VGRRNKNRMPEPPHESVGPPVWLQIAQAEIELSMQAGTGGPHDALDQALKMEARMKAEYPDMPFEVKSEFRARLRARGYTQDAWDAAVDWLESTDYGSRLRRRRYSGGR